MNQKMSILLWSISMTEIKKQNHFVQATFQIWIVLEHDPDLEQMFQIRLLI